MTAIGTNVYLYGGQVKSNFFSFLHMMAAGLFASYSIWMMESRACPEHSCNLQDPVTGICYDDILMLDTLTWNWSFVEVIQVSCFKLLVKSFCMHVPCAWTLP